LKYGSLGPIMLSLNYCSTANGLHQQPEWPPAGGLTQCLMLYLFDFRLGQEDALDRVPRPRRTLWGLCHILGARGGMCWCTLPGGALGTGRIGSQTRLICIGKSLWSKCSAPSYPPCSSMGVNLPWTCRASAQQCPTVSVGFSSLIGMAVQH
jgi:hypothetical protein